MSVILSGPRRVYVVLLMWCRVDDASPAALPALSEIDRAIGSGDPRRREQHAGSIAHAVLTVRLQRILWRRLVGLSLLVFHSSP